MKLVRIGLEHPDIRFEIFYGASNNEAGWWDNSNARRFGYVPMIDRKNSVLRQWRSRQSSLPIRSATVSRAGRSVRTNMTPIGRAEVGYAP